MKKAITTATLLICLSAVLSSCSAKDNVTDTASTASATESVTEAEKTEAATEAEETEAPAAADADAADFIGKWQAKDIIVDGEKSDDLWGAPAFTLFQIELNEDNTGTFTSFLFTDIDPEQITWSFNDEGKVVLEAVNEDIDLSGSYFVKEGDGMVFDMSDEMSEFKADLEKVDEFTPIPEDTEMSFSYSSEDDESFGGEWEISVDGDDVTVSEVTSE
ncbi:MAG: hypothetical protein J5501_01080 [Ruminococcus sp.]|nr:hypothetical protein [Ruminococcus sp.]